MLSYYSYFWCLKLYLRSMCGAKSALLYSMCKAKYALLYSLYGANLLRTWKRTSYFAAHMNRVMLALLHTCNGDIISGTKRTTKSSQNCHICQISRKHLCTIYINFYMTKVTTFEDQNIMRKFT